jgi:hypothetical protein
MATSATPSVTFDALNRELRSVVAFFAARTPDTLQWTVRSHVLIAPGTQLGVWLWSDGTQTAFVAPPGCSGYLADISDRVNCPLLGSSPSQFLLILD